MAKKNVQLNLLDKFFNYVQPQTALQRVAARTRLESLRAYEATANSRNRLRREDGRSADQINAGGALERLRLQARYLEENHDIANSVLDTLVNFVIGDGLNTLPQVKDINGELLPDINKRLTVLWEDWIKRPEVTHELDWSGVQRMGARTAFRDGEVLGQLLTGPVADVDHGTQVQFSVQLLEPDYCPVAYDDERRGIKQGVRKNRWGKPEAYYFYTAYPSELYGINFVSTGIASGIIDPSRIEEIDAANVLHLKMIKRLRQTRGVSIFASTFQRLDDLKDYEESERIAARVAAAFALAITKPWDAPPGETTAPDWREMELAPGIIADNLAPGEKIEAIKNERPSNQLMDFRSSQLRAVAGGTGTGYSSIAKSYEGSYSSQRQELIEQHGAYGALRKMVVASFHAPIYRRFVETVRLQGLVDFTNADPLTYYDAQHIGRGVPYIEPAREIQADETAINVGIKSLTQVIQEKGGDPAKVMEQIARERKEQKEKGLTFTTTTQPENGGAADVNEADNNTADNDDANADDANADTENAGRGKDASPVVLRGRRGRRGEKGSAPAHRFKDGKLQFELPGGGWGNPIDLAGLIGKGGKDVS